MFEKLFGFNPKETTVRTEIMAGITTGGVMAILTNALIQIKDD